MQIVTRCFIPYSPVNTPPIPGVISRYQLQNFFFICFQTSQKHLSQTANANEHKQSYGWILNNSFCASYFNEQDASVDLTDSRPWRIAVKFFCTISQAEKGCGHICPWLVRTKLTNAIPFPLNSFGLGFNMQEMSKGLTTKH